MVWYRAHHTRMLGTPQYSMGLVCPVAAARAAVATGALGQIDTRHVCDAWKCGSLSFILPTRRKIFSKNRKKRKGLVCSAYRVTLLSPPQSDEFPNNINIDS